MEQLLTKLLALLEERKNVKLLLDVSQPIKIGIPAQFLNLDPNHPILGNAYTNLKTEIDTTLTQYRTWLNGQIKSTATDIIAQI